jgi:hypothetical protein
MRFSASYVKSVVYAAAPFTVWPTCSTFPTLS